MINVGIFLFNDVELLDFAGPYEVFSVTAELNDGQFFQVFTLSSDGSQIKSVNGLTVIPDYSFDNHPPVDLLVIREEWGQSRKSPSEKFLPGSARFAKPRKSPCRCAREPESSARLGFSPGLSR